MDDIKLALLGNKEAAKRLTDAGVLLPCPHCKGRAVLVEGTLQASGKYNQAELTGGTLPLDAKHRIFTQRPQRQRSHY